MVLITSVFLLSSQIRSVWRAAFASPALVMPYFNREDLRLFPESRNPLTPPFRS